MSPLSDWPIAPPAGGAPSARRVQYAALPYRVRRDGEVQIRLITSRETRRWVVPKGWPIKGLTPPKTAAREAYEEAGLIGVVSREPMGSYTYEKRLGSRSVLCDVLLFPLKVKRLLQKWPERFQRYGFWFSVETAAAAVQEEDLAALIVAFGAVMARRWEEKQRAAAPKAGSAASAQKTPPGAPLEDDARARPSAAASSDGSSGETGPRDAGLKSVQPKQARSKAGKSKDGVRRAPGESGATGKAAPKQVTALVAVPPATSDAALPTDPEAGAMASAVDGEWGGKTGSSKAEKLKVEKIRSKAAKAKPGRVKTVKAASDKAGSDLPKAATASFGTPDAPVAADQPDDVLLMTRQADAASASPSGEKAPGEKGASKKSSSKKSSSQKVSGKSSERNDSPAESSAAEPLKGRPSMGMPVATGLGSAEASTKAGKAKAGRKSRAPDPDTSAT